MDVNPHFKRLLSYWKKVGMPAALQSIDGFYLSRWLKEAQQVEAEFIEELEDNLLKTSKEDELKYLAHLLTKLAELPEVLARLPTAVPTNLLRAFKAERPLKHTAFYRRVTAALAASQAIATPPYDNEQVAHSFQGEYIQAAFLDLYLRVNRELQKRTVPPVVGAAFSSDASPILLQVDMVDLLDLLEIMQERGDWKLKEQTSRKILCQRIAALFELPTSKKGAQSPDWKRFYDLMAARESDKSKTRTNRSKKGLYDAIKPVET